MFFRLIDLFPAPKPIDTVIQSSHEIVPILVNNTSPMIHPISQNLFQSRFRLTETLVSERTVIENLKEKLNLLIKQESILSIDDNVCIPLPELEDKDWHKKKLEEFEKEVNNLDKEILEKISSINDVGNIFL